MGTRTGQYIADGAWTVVNEATGGAAVRWPTAEALRWVNDGQVAVVAQVPSAFVKRVVPAALVAGARQDLAGLSITDGLLPLNVSCNYAADGTTVGRAITRRDQVWFDEYLPTWRSVTATEAEHWMPDERDPKAFHLYPAVTGGGRVEVIYSAVPPDLGSLAATIALDDVYVGALQAFVLFKFYTKDANYSRNPQVAGSYWNQFLYLLGSRDKAVMQGMAMTAAKAAGQ